MLIKELFLLIRLGIADQSLTDADIQPLLKLTPDQWEELRQLLSDQGVLGITYDGFHALADQQ